jgi:hypothetical protein
MSAHIADCIDDWDVEGEGEALDEALEDIAKKCENTADAQEATARRLREAAARYRAMREVKP